VSARAPMTACLVGAAIATGCGGDEPEWEKERVRAARQEFKEKGYELGDVSEVPQ
jgi:hypothetical protein